MAGDPMDWEGVIYAGLTSKAHSGDSDESHPIHFQLNFNQRLAKRLSLRFPARLTCRLSELIDIPLKNTVYIGVPS